MSENKLTLSIHVRNEEKRLHSFLEHIKGFSNDIVIIDDFSTDKTLEIAKKYKCRVFSLRTDSYAEKQNFAASKAKNEWVLFIDVDERLDDELKEAIINTINSNPKEHLFYIRRKEYFMHKLYSITWQPRLYRKNKVKWIYPIHEEPVFEGSAGYIKKGYEYHYPNQDINSIIKKTIYYTDLETKKISHFGKSRLIFSMIFLPMYYFFVYLFYARYIRGGIPGIIFSFNGAYYKHIMYAKCYEKKYVNKDSD